MCYNTCVYATIKLNAPLEWRLTKPHSDFQTREHDIEEFIKEFNCAQQQNMVN